MSDLALNASGISHRYGNQQALLDITFSLPKGTRFTLEQNVHVVGQERPALVYELVFIYQ